MLLCVCVCVCVCVSAKFESQTVYQTQTRSMGSSFVTPEFHSLQFFFIIFQSKEIGQRRFVCFSPAT